MFTIGGLIKNPLSSPFKDYHMQGTSDNYTTRVLYDLSKNV